MFRLVAFLLLAVSPAAAMLDADPMPTVSPNIVYDVGDVGTAPNPVSEMVFVQVIDSVDAQLEEVINGFACEVGAVGANRYDGIFEVAGFSAPGITVSLSGEVDVQNSRVDKICSGAERKCTRDTFEQRHVFDIAGVSKPDIGKLDPNALSSPAIFGRYRVDSSGRTASSVG